MHVSDSSREFKAVGGAREVDVGQHDTGQMSLSP
jgi:hypothetical protein